MKQIVNCIKEQNCFNQIFRWVSIITMLIAWAIVLHFIYIQLMPIDVIKVDGLYAVDKKEVKASEVITVTQKFCKEKPYAGELRVYFHDGIYFLFNQFKTNENVGCQDLKVSYTVPETLPTGTYQILYVVNYKVSPFRVVEERIETDYFYVINE